MNGLMNLCKHDFTVTIPFVWFYALLTAFQLYMSSEQVYIKLMSRVS